MHLTAGQAETVLRLIGSDPSRLHTWGRGVPGLERVATVSQWSLLGLLAVLVTFSSPGGILIAAAMAGVVVLLRRGRRRRQIWEDEHWSPDSSVPQVDGLDGSGPSDPGAAVAPAPMVGTHGAQIPPPAIPASGDVRDGYELSLGRSQWPNVDLKGEFAYTRAIRSALRAGGAPLADGSHSEVEGLGVELVPEPDNPHDANAVSIRWRNQLLGYLSGEDALRYAPVVRRLVASGYRAETTVRIWAFGSQGRVEARVTAALPDPELIAPLNDAPSAVHTVIPWGTAVQVLKAEDHFEVLFNYVPEGGVGLVLVSLHKAVRTLKNGSERSYVEVRLDGQHVGELSPVTSPQFLPLIEHTEAVGELAVAYAKITGSALAARLVLQAAKATEISNEWLATGPHPAPQLLPWARDYEVPPAYIPAG